MKTMACVAILLALVGMASADITLEVVPVDNSPGGAPLDGFITQDLVVTTDTDWLSAEMAVTLDTPGQIYQDALGNTNPQSPNPAFFPIAASLEFDTYVSNGVLGESVSVTGVIIIPPDLTAFSIDHINILWYTTATEDIGTLALARVTLAETANGMWEFWATAVPQGGPRAEVLGGIVENGVMYIPEPATFGICAICSLVCLRREPKSR